MKYFANSECSPLGLRVPVYGGFAKMRLGFELEGFKQGLFLCIFG